MVQLQPFVKDDYAALISWVESAELLMQFAGPGFEFPLTAIQLDNHLTSGSRKVYKVVYTPTGKHIGHAEIFLAENSAYLSRILIGKSEHRGKGLGYQVISQLLEIVFGHTQKTIAELNVFDWNIAAIKCYQKAGFVLNPNKKSERKINGLTWLVHNMVLEKEQWQARRQTT